MTKNYFHLRNSLCSLVTAFMLCVSFNSAGQHEFIQFKTEFEKEVLSNIQEHSDLEILIAISENGSEMLAKQIDSQIAEFKADLSRQKFNAKSEDKQLKLLFDHTHKNFFMKYKEVSNFTRIFEAKEYNCVSATALYCLILKDNKIPFLIKETPTHVYAIAYPATKGIILESTAPQHGYYSPAPADIQKAVGALVELKYYTEEEVNSKGAREVYNEFFYDEDEINIKQLAGLQYHNETVTYFSEEKYVLALNSNYKSHLLYPSNRTEYLSYVLLANILNKADFSKLSDIKYLVQYANLPMVNKSEVVDAYRTIINNQLFLNSEKKKMDSAFMYMTQHISDSTLMKNISEVHLKSYAEFYIKKSDFNKSLEFSSQAYKLNPHDVNIQALITHCLTHDLSRRAGNANTITKMDQYQLQFPFLETNSLYQSLYFYAYTYNAFNHFRADDIKGGMSYLESMEALIDRVGELRYDENQYGLVYAEAGAAYYRKHNYVAAKRIIEKGLSILPEHPELKVRLQIVLDEMKR